MRIEDVSARVFKTTTRRHADTAGHAHPGPAHQVEMAMLTIRTDNGDEGYCFSPPQIVREHVLEKFVRRVLIGAIRSTGRSSGRSSRTGSAAAPRS